MIPLPHFTPVPVRVQVLRRFAAGDPWHEGCAAEWTLNLYRIVPEYEGTRVAPKAAQPLPVSEQIAGDPREARLRGDEAIGIETGGWTRLLPRALNRLWAQGEVNDEALPLLIRALEPRLRRRDFLRPLVQRGLWVIASVFGIPAAACLALYLYWAPEPGHAFRYVDAKAWLAAPAVAETVALTSGFTPIMGSVELGSGDFTVPAGLAMPSGTLRLGWLAAPNEARLILYPARTDPAAHIIEGPVVLTAAMALSPAALARLRPGAPRLNTEFVLVQEGAWADQVGAPMVTSMLPWIAAFLAAPTILCLAIDIATRRRDARITTAFRDAFATVVATRGRR